VPKSHYSECDARRLEYQSRKDRMIYEYRKDVYEPMIVLGSVIWHVNLP
jgi:hypothetical protein